MTAPFVGHPKDVLDDIIDILILTPVLYSYLDEISASTSTREATKIKSKLESQAKALIAELSKIGTKLKNARGKLGEGGNQSASSYRSNVPIAESDFLPLVVAYYHTAQILILSVMTQAKQSYLHQRQMIAHCQFILLNVEVALTVEGLQSAMVGALHMVQLLSPDVEQKRRAGDLLMSLYMKGGAGARLANRTVAQMRYSTDERWIRRDINTSKS